MRKPPLDFADLFGTESRWIRVKSVTHTFNPLTGCTAREVERPDGSRLIAEAEQLVEQVRDVPPTQHGGDL